MQISCAVTAPLISAFVFEIRIISTTLSTTCNCDGTCQFVSDIIRNPYSCGYNAKAQIKYQPGISCTDQFPIEIDIKLSHYEKDAKVVVTIDTCWLPLNG